MQTFQGHSVFICSFFLYFFVSLGVYTPLCCQKERRKRMKRLCLLGWLLFWVISVSSQEVYDSLQTFYRAGSSRIDTLYMRNGETMSSFFHRNLTRFHHPDFDLKRVIIVGSSSPEGRLKSNEALALRRAQSLSTYIKKQLPLKEHQIEVTSVGVDWWKLTDMVMEAKDMPNQKEVLDVLQKGYLHNERLRLMKRVNGGLAYRWMYKHLFPQLRYTKVLIIYDLKEQPVVQEEIPQLPVVEIESPVLTKDTIVSDLNVDLQPKQQKLSSEEIVFLRSNVLLPLGNFGIEVPIGTQWSVGADFYYPWLSRKSDHKNCFQVLMWNLEGRYWFGQDRKKENVLEGHSVGFNTMVGYYDLEKNYEGYQGDFVNFSFDYTYGMPILNNKLHLEFTVGLGYFFSKATKYEVFEKGGKGYKSGYKEKFQYIGPNKLAVSIVVPIKIKGGK